MNFKRILEIAKNNLFSVICLVVALAAVAATFWPLGGMMTGLQTLAEGRASIYSQLESLLSQPRKLPLTDPTKTTQDDLTQFPNQKTVEEGNRVTDNLTKQSKALVDFVKNLNAKDHNPLVDGVLPVAVSPTAKFHFGDIYKLALSIDPNDSINTNPKLKEANQPNLRNDILNGGLPPTQAEIQQTINDMWANDYSPKIISQNGVQKNLAEIQARFQEASAKVPDRLKTDVALKKKLYVNTDAFTINDSVTGVREPIPTDIWFAQLTFWIQQDIAQAIAQANANSKNIVDAPVKHLLKLSIPMSPTPYVGLALANAGTAAPPTPFENSAAQPITKNFSLSPTGRVSNAMYDVVQFTLRVRLQASQIPFFIQTLGQDRLINVYNFTQVSVDSLEAKSAGYIYGPAPVVEVSLNCEELYMRDWSVPLMPDVVRKLLNIAPPVTPAPGAQAFAQ